MPELGRAALVAAFGLILYAVLAGAYAAWRGRRRLLDSATNALAAFAAVGVASLVLLAALARNDFSLDYVARLTSRELPNGYTLAAFWSGQEGSLLLWLLVLTGAASAAVALNRRLVREVLPGPCRSSAASRSSSPFCSSSSRARSTRRRRPPTARA